LLALQRCYLCTCLLALVAKLPSCQIAWLHCNLCNYSSLTHAHLQINTHRDSHSCVAIEYWQNEGPLTDNSIGRSSLCVGYGLTVFHYQELQLLHISWHIFGLKYFLLKEFIIGVAIEFCLSHDKLKLPLTKRTLREPK